MALHLSERLAMTIPEDLSTMLRSVTKQVLACGMPLFCFFQGLNFTDALTF